MASAIPPGMDLCAIPLAQAPPGEVNNFVNPPDQTTDLIATTAATTSIALLFIIRRFYVNWKKMKAADYLVIVGLAFSIAYSGLVLNAHKYTRHEWNLPLCWFLNPEAYYMKLSFAIGMVFGWAQFFVKAPLLVMYFDIFKVQTGMRVGIVIGLVFSLAIAIVSAVLDIVYMTPHGSDTWMGLVTSNQVQGFAIWAPTHGSLMVFLDVYIFLLPLSTILKLKMTFKKKVQVTAVFLTALLGVICSANALRYRVYLTRNEDHPWNTAKAELWSIIEHNVALVVACMPSFASLMRIPVSEWAVVKTVRSKLSNSSILRSSRRDDDSSSKESLEKSDRAYYPYYYELSDAGVNTQTTIRGPPHQPPAAPAPAASNPAKNGGVHVVRTMDVHLESQHHDPRDAV